jgi:uncharacterized protein (DUF2345 family)
MSIVVETDLSTWGQMTTRDIQTRTIFNNETADTGLTIESIADFMDILVGSTLNISVTGDYILGVTGDYVADLETSYNLSIGTTGRIISGDDFLLDVGTTFTVEANDMDFNADGYIDITTGTSMNLVAGTTIALEGGMGVEITTGSMGQIVLTGHELIIDTAGNTMMDTDGTIDILAGTSMNLHAVDGITIDTNTTTGKVVITGNELIVNTTIPFSAPTDTVVSAGFARVQAGTTLLISSDDQMIVNAGNGLVLSVTGQDLDINATDCVDVDAMGCVDINAGTSMNLVSGTTMTLNAVEEMLIDADAGLNLDVEGDYTNITSGQVVIEAGTTLDLSGADVSIDATVDITMTSGVSMLLDSADRIDLSVNTVDGRVVISGYELVVDTTVPFGGNAGSLISNDNIVISTGTTLTMGSIEDMIITANGLQLSVSGDQNLNIDVVECIDVDAQGCVDINAGTSMNLVSGTTMTLNAVGEMLIDADAGLNLDVEGDYTSNTSGSMTLNSGGTSTFSANVMSVLCSNTLFYNVNEMDINVTGLYDLQTTDTISIDSLEGAINIGSDADTGAINIGNNSTRTITMGESTSTLNMFGASVTLGNTGSAVDVLGNTTVYGDFTVFGDSVEINAAEVTIDDNNIVLNGISSPTDTSANGGGITLKGDSDITILYDKDCPSVGTTGSWSFNQNININDTLGYYINCELAMDQTKMVVNATGSDDGIYFNGPSSVSTPANQDLRMTAVSSGGKTGIEIQQYDGASWVRIWRVLGSAL